MYTYPPRVFPWAFRKYKIMTQDIPPRPLRVLIAEDHPLVLNSIRRTLADNWKDIEFSEVFSLKSLEDFQKKESYDLLVLDLQLADGNSIHIIRYLKMKNPDQKILILSAAPEEIFATRLLRLGVDGYLSKRCSQDELLNAIREVLAGNKFLSQAIQRELALGSVLHKQDSERLFEGLSDREFEIALLLLAGKSVLDISRLLNIQSSTVSTHKNAIFTKLRVTNLIEMSEVARREGLQEG